MIKFPEKEAWLGLRKRGVPGKYIRLVQLTYINETTGLRSAVGKADYLIVAVGLDMISVVSLFHLDIAFNVLLEGVGESPPWCVLYADVILVTGRRGDSEAYCKDGDNIGNPWNVNKQTLDRTYMPKNFEGRQDKTIQIVSSDLKRGTNFKYLGSMMQIHGDVDNEIAHSVQSRWNNWRKITGVLYDRKVHI